jgi:hypothetical protein
LKAIYLQCTPKLRMADGDATAGCGCGCVGPQPADVPPRWPADKRGVLHEVARVLRPGGRFAVSDLIADDDMDEATRGDMEQWTGCVAGALTRRACAQALPDAGLTEVVITETPCVHEHAGSAQIRARTPSA